MLCSPALWDTSGPPEEAAPGTCPDGGSAPREPGPGVGAAPAPTALTCGAARAGGGSAGPGGARNRYRRGRGPAAGSAPAAPAPLVAAGPPPSPAATLVHWLGVLTIKREGPRDGGRGGILGGTGMLGGEMGPGCCDREAGGCWRWDAGRCWDRDAGRCRHWDPGDAGPPLPAQGTLGHRGRAEAQRREGQENHFDVQDQTWNVSMEITERFSR